MDKRMIRLFRVAFVIIDVAASTAAAAPTVRLTFDDGRVWLVAA
jgi:hypothetical protein